MSTEDKRYILNLVGVLSETLTNYFAKSGMDLVSRDQVSNYEQLDYILVATGEEAKQAAKDFSADKNDIQVVCLGQVKEVKDFLLYNGRLIIEQEFVGSQLGEFILNKFFNKNYNIHLDESYSALFQNPKELKLTNHLATGIYIDEISNSAFQNGYNVVALRSFMDHVIYYFTYLKQAGLAGVPYEVEYDNNENFFVVNIYCQVKNFVAEYMIDSFGPVNSKDPLQYLLGVVARSTDFLEVTYIENPGRLVLTAAWGRNEKKRLNGLSFNNVYTTAQTIAQLDKKVKEYKDVQEEIQEQEQVQEKLKPQSLPGSILEMVVSTDENSILNKEPEKASNIVAFAVAKFEEEYPDRSINDIDEEEFAHIISDYPEADDVVHLTDDDKEHLLDRVQKNNITQAYDEEIQRVRDNLEDEDDFKQELQNTMTEEVAKRVSIHMDADTLNKILGSKDEKEVSQKVGGSKEDADDFMVKISGMEEDKTKVLFTTNLGSSLEKKAKDFNAILSNSAPEDRKKQMNWFVKSSVSDAAKKSGLDIKVQSFLEENASKKIEKELEGYAARIGKTIETLSESQIIEFKDTELPNIVSSVIDDEVSIDEFKAELEKGIDRIAPSVFNGMTPEFETKFSAKLESRLESLESVEKIDDKYVVTNEQVGEDQMQQIIQTTMKETMDEEFKLDKANKTEIEKKEKEIIENLSATLSFDKEEVAEIVKGGTKKAKDKEVQVVVDNIFKEKPGEEEAVIVEDKVFGTDKKKEEIVKSQAEDDKKVALLAETEQKVEKPQESSQDQPQAQQAKTNNLAEAELIKKLKQQEAENKKLQSQMKAMEVKLKSATQSNAKAQEIDKNAKAEAEQEVKAQEQKDKAANGENKKEQKGEITQLTQDEAQKLSEELKEGKNISSEDAKKVQNLLQKEQEILGLVKKAEAETKKAEIQSNKKEALYKSELEKANRTLKAKDMVIEKAKESMQAIVGKKEGEIKGLIKQVEELNQRLNSDETTKLRAQVKSLMSDNESLGRSAEMYKNKLDSFVKSKKANEKADNSAALTEEVRQLKGLKNQMENKLNSLTKEKHSLDDRYNKLKVMETKYRTESTSLKAAVKDLEYKFKSAKENEARLASMAEKVKNQGDSGQSSKEIEMLKTQNGQLQAKLKELTEKLRSGGGVGAGAGNQSAKEKHLEKTNKMLQAEITKARGELDNTKKELMKMKGESTSLKNKMKALEREVDKHKKAA
jgi:hypothetical protein